MYQALILPLVDKLLEGFQCTALAYGQTGTGKSYSMGMTPPGEVGFSFSHQWLKSFPLIYRFYSFTDTARAPGYSASRPGRHF